MKLKRNSIFSVVEVLVSGLGLFLIYRSVVAELGLAMLGVWSIVLATTSFGRMADLGIAAGLARFIATARGEGNLPRAGAYFWTGLASVTMLMAVVTLVAWLPLHAALAIALGGGQLEAARGLLPWALLTFWLLSINAALSASLLGLQRADLRAVVSISGMILQVAASYLLVKRWGLLGLAWAQTAQYILAIGISLTMIVALRAIPMRVAFTRSAFKELIGFGAKLQVGTISNLLFEPLSKIVLGVVAGAATVGVFEMAYRMVYQVRSVAIMALQNLVPAFAELQQSAPERSLALFVKSNRIAAASATLLMSAIVIASPLISLVWLRSYSVDFVLFTCLVSLCWTVNVLCAPSYFFGMATGRINANIGGQVLTGVLSPLLALMLGRWGGPAWAVLGVVAGKAIGDALPAIFNHPGEGWSCATILMPSTFGAVALVGVLGAAMDFYIGPHAATLLESLHIIEWLQS